MKGHKEVHVVQAPTGFRFGTGAANAENEAMACRADGVAAVAEIESRRLPLDFRQGSHNPRELVVKLPTCRAWRATFDATGNGSAGIADFGEFSRRAEIAVDFNYPPVQLSA